ncbi:hypothetical protein C8Q78DRAFT_506857 [Trametes maxima]|nr:hypothetical protein C8Q78DRAFT_506857 [Trametes maxima]
MPYRRMLCSVVVPSPLHRPHHLHLHPHHHRHPTLTGNRISFSTWHSPTTTAPPRLSHPRTSIRSSLSACRAAAKSLQRTLCLQLRTFLHVTTHPASVEAAGVPSRYGTPGLQPRGRKGEAPFPALLLLIRL